jgi:uncharacterized protein
MTSPAATLRELHRLRRHAKDLQTEIERAPRLLKAHQAKVTRQEETLRVGQDALKRLKVVMHDKEGELKTAQQLVTKYEDQRNKATSKKEYDAAQAEINSTRKKCQQIEDQILDAMGDVETKTAELPELEKGIKLAKQELAEFEKTNQTRLVSLTEQLKEAQRQLTEVEAALPDDVRTHYNRLVGARGEDALAAVQDRTCVACYTSITAQQHNELIQAQFVVCKSCGRILYLPA